MIYDNTLTTIEAVTRYLQKEQGGAPSLATFQEFETNITEYIHAASSAFERECGRVFVPQRQTRKYTRQQIARNSFAVYPALFLKTDLSKLVSISAGGAVVDSSTYRAMPLNESPKLFVEFSSVPSGTGFNDELEILGEFGYLLDEQIAYTESTTLSADASATATTISVVSVAGIERLGYIRISDELMRVTDIDTLTLTVERGVSGFTAGEHASGAVVSRLRIVPDVKNAVTAWAAYLYRRSQSDEETVRLPDGTTISTRMPKIVSSAIRRYRDVAIEVLK